MKEHHCMSPRDATVLTWILAGTILLLLLATPFIVFHVETRETKDPSEPDSCMELRLGDPLPIHPDDSTIWGVRFDGTNVITTLYVITLEGATQAVGRSTGKLEVQE